MNKEEVKALLDRYQEGTCSQEEKAVVESWYNVTGEKNAPLGVKQDLEAVMDEIWTSVYADAGFTKQRHVYSLWKKLTVAAAVAAITLGLWLYVSEIASSRKASRNDDLVANDIAPGKNTATLTLANGKTINLDTNKTSVVVTDSVKTMTMLTASTPRGGTYQVTLPDGSHVWLNADSKISFPSQFIGRERKVLLISGEAYFEVAKLTRSSLRGGTTKQTPERIPFLVESSGQTVEVLGTHFNINSYADEGSTKTTLLEGSVNVNGTILKPDQQASLKGEAITVKAIDTDEVIAWKNGLFAYDHTLLGEVMRQASRWYDVTILYEDESLKQKKLSGSVTRYDNISGLLNAISYTTGVKFKIEGRKITISK